MCGLCGIAGNLNYNLENKVFRDMLDVCQVRGRDSTGVFKVRRDNSYTWVKNIGPPTNLVDHRIYDQTLSPGGVAKIMAGHCRSKTVGDITIKNAHPFDVDDKLIGMHNGTLKNHWSLDTSETGMVDSEILMRHIAKHGPKKSFSEIRGAWACVWYDKEAETLNFIRNDERPLYLVRSESGDLLAWASEPWMFGALGRATKLGEIISLSEDTWLAYPMVKGTDEIGKARTAKIEKRKDSETFDFSGFTGAFPGNNVSGSRRHVHGRNRGVGQSGSNVTPLHIPARDATDKKKPPAAVDPFTNKPCCTVRDVAGIEFITNSHTGLEYSKEKFLEKSGGHCCFCEAQVDDLKEVAEMFSEEYFICQTCFEDCYGEEAMKRAN